MVINLAPLRRPIQLRAIKRRRLVWSVIASEAKQSMHHNGKEWIASSLALLAMTTKHGFAISPRLPREVLFDFPPSPNRGRRECRAPDAPAAACAMIVVERTRVSQVTPESPGIPRAMVYGLSRALPGDRLVDTVTGEVTSANLTPAPRRQDHTTSPSALAPFVKGAAHVHRIPPRVRDDREPPLCGTGRGEFVKMICPTGKAKYFCEAP
jgi:hypothetical protein